MKRNVLMLAIASMFIVGTTLGQSQTKMDKSEKSSQKQEQTSTQKADKTSSEKPGKSSTSDGSNASAEQKAREATDKMTSELGLNSQQQQQAMQTNLTYFKGLENMKSSANENTDKSQMQARKDEMNQKRMSEFQTYLTSDQYSKMQSKMSSSNGQSGGSNSGMTKEEKKEKAAGMSAEEKQQMKSEKKSKKGGE